MANIFLSVFGNSVSTGLVVGALLILTPFLNKRYAAKWKYMIWIVLALRLMIPFGGTNGQSVMDMLPQRKPQSVTEAENGNAGALPGGTVLRRVIVEIPTQMTTPIAVSPEKSDSSVTVLDIVAFVWMFGSLTFISVHMASYLHYKRQIMKKGTVVRDSRILYRILKLKRELHIKSAIRPIEYPEASGPMVIGFGKPVLVLPEEQYSEEELFFILKHELVHLKRGDVYFKLLFMVANAVHWFNPLIWMMQKEAAIDMELSCDERVTQGANYAVRRAYTETLLSTIHKQCVRRTVLSTQFYGGKQIMKKRLKNVLIKTGKKNGVSILLCAAVLTVCLGTLIGCSVQESSKKGLVGESGEDNLNETFSVGLDNQMEKIETLAADSGGAEDTVMPLPSEKEAENAVMPVPSETVKVVEPMDKTFLTIMREGEKEEMPATLFAGEGYSLYLTDGNWQQYAADAWSAVIDGQTVLDGKVQLWVAHYEGKSAGQVEEELKADGYVTTETNAMWKQEGELIRNVRLNEFENDVWGVFYCCPVAAEEGWGRILSVIADTFAVSVPAEGYLTDTDRQEIKKIVDEFATAYFGGNADTIQKFLAGTYGGKVSVYEGMGTISDLTVKGLSGADEQRSGSGTYIVSLEYRDSENADTFRYLTFEFIRQGDGWKIQFYGLEG